MRAGTDGAFSMEGDDDGAVDVHNTVSGHGSLNSLTFNTVPVHIDTDFPGTYRIIGATENPVASDEKTSGSQTLELVPNTDLNWGYSLIVHNLDNPAKDIRYGMFFVRDDCSIDASFLTPEDQSYSFESQGYSLSLGCGAADSDGDGIGDASETIQSAAMDTTLRSGEKHRNEGANDILRVRQSGKVNYYSREGAEAAGDPSLAPKLIFE